MFSTFSALGVALALVIPSAAMAFDAPQSASWHGRAIQAPKQQPDAVTAAVSLPRSWSAGPVRLGTGFRRATGSDRVREVQERLWRLGYRPGPVDGLFGPQTAAAVKWFQLKHGIKPDAIVGAQTLSLLRDRSGAPPESAATGEPVRDTHEGAPGAAPQPQGATPVADRSQKPAGGQGGGGASPLLLLLLAVPAALALTALRRGRRAKDGPPAAAREPDVPAADRKAAPAPLPRPAPPAAAHPEESTAIGYVRATAGDRAELARHAGAIRRSCTERGWKVTELVCDDRQTGSRRAFDRPGLAAAMEHLAGAGPSRLVVSKLAHLSRSQADLTALLEWFDRHDVQLIAVDVGLDTTTQQGRRAAQSQLSTFARRQVRAHANGSNGGTKKATVNGASVRT